MTLKISPPWWQTDDYTGDFLLPQEFRELAGAQGPALVKAWDSGKTDPGWGLNPPKHSKFGFMPRYLKGSFDPDKILGQIEEGQADAFAIVMRSVRMVCIDIDGKNGGFEGVRKLGMLPPTMSEISKSGNGYHLFYEVDDEWDDEKGFGLLADRLGIQPGVDIRATGCVYHYPQQRWNFRAIAPLPEFIKEQLLHREQQVLQAHSHITAVLAAEDDMEVLMMQNELIEELKKPIPAGKRNVSLFAIGNKMRMAQVPGWQDLIRERGEEIGLPEYELKKLVKNLEAQK